jgi:putative ABC transport system substrate-binding protein
MSLPRRDFITLLGGAVAWPLAARAQQPAGGMPHLAVGIASPQFAAELAAFRAALVKLGWVEGRNIRTDVRWGYTLTGEFISPAQFAAELVSLAPNVILSQASDDVKALLQETRTIPIVFAATVDPLANGLVNSVAHPGGNVTGFTAYDPPIGGKWLELLKEVAPDIKRVLVILGLDSIGQLSILRAIEAAAPGFGVQIAVGPRLPDVSTAAIESAAIERDINTFAQEPNGGLLVFFSSIALANRDLILGLAARHRLPAMYASRAFMAGGGLMSYDTDFVNIFERAASYVDRILRGEKPGDLPVQAPTKFNLIINLKTAKALGLTIPLPLLGLAQEVIE